MKNLISLATRTDIHDYVGALWKSEPFRQSYEGRGFVFEQVSRFAYLPRLFAESSNDHLERAHFSTWWNVIMIRDDYTNPFIHDLYYLHEMAHAASMPYIPEIGRAAFDEKMQRNELEASVLSEIAVYFEMPGLRQKSFDHEIYADRFLDDPEMQRLWSLNREVAVETLRSMRRDVMVSKDEAHMDLTEQWIRKFERQNAVYGSVWADRYDEIEQHMNRLQNDSVPTDGRSGAAQRMTALAIYRSWLEAEAARDPIDNIPFREEAELFSPHYWSNKAKYSAAMSAAERKAA